MRRLRLGLFAAATAASIAWISHVPYCGLRMARAVPRGARWVSRHRNVAARWDALAQSPLVSLSGRALGADGSAWRNLIGSAAARWWVDRIAGREVWLFDVPSGFEGRAIGGAAWLGGRAARWRVAFQTGRVVGFDRCDEHGGRTIWVLRQPLDQRGARLALAIEEGLLLACLSLDPSDLRHVLNAYDGAIGRCDRAVDLLDAGEPDAALGGWGRDLRSPGWRLGLRRADAEGLEGDLAWEGIGVDLPPSALDPSPSRPRLAASVERQAALSLRAAPSAADAVLAPALRGWTADLWRLLRDSAAGPLHAAVFGDPLYGRLRGLRVPGFVVSLPLRDVEGFPARIDRLLDEWNTARRWGLIRGPMPGTSRVTMIEGTDSGPYRGLPAGECAAYVIEDGWLTLAPAADTLRMLLAIDAASGASAGMPPSPAADAGVEFRLDPGRLVEVVRLGLSVYSLLRLVADAEGSADQRRALERVAESLGALSDLGPADGSLAGDGPHVRIAFRVASPSAGPAPGAGGNPP